MLKKILGIFKRDKADFSNEELVFQRRGVYIIASVLALVMLSLIVMVICKNELRHNDILSITYSASLCIGIFVTTFLSEAINDELEKRRKEQRKQRRKQWKEKQKKEILTHIGKKEYEEVQSTELLNRIVLKALFLSDKIQIDNRRGYLEGYLRIGKIKQLIFRIKQDEILRYFKLRKNENNFIFDDEEDDLWLDFLDNFEDDRE